MQVAAAVDGQRWIRRFADRCQTFVGRIGSAPRADVAAMLRELADSVPPLPARERFVLSTLVGQLLGTLARMTGIAANSELAAAFVVWASTGTSDGQPGEVRRLAARCAFALEMREDARLDAVAHPRVGSALQLIEQRFADPRLAMKDVADRLGTSVSHAARLLKQATGSSFNGHVHRLRIAAARRLLRDTTLSVKEIAGAVGYGSSSQFGRHFRRLTGTTPHNFRSGVAA